MSDSNMNFENTENLMDEEPPPILSSEIREVFYLFANMLDIKSFMKLAMASKEMYERCMQDKMIKLKLTGWDVYVNVNGAPMFSFYSPDTYKQKRKYLEKVRQLKCYVSLRRIRFEGDRIDANAIMDTRRYLETLNVKAIESLKIDGEFVGWHEISFIKDYQIRNVEIDGGLPDDVLRSFLQSNLNSFSYNGPVQGDLILQVDSTIPEISLPSMKPSADVFIQILWNIQSSAVKKLILSMQLVPWTRFKEVWENHDGPLPEDRPLLIANREFPFLHCCWLLHSNGDVTKCEARGSPIYEFFKCEPNDVPVIVISKESVHQALAEKRDKVRCTRSHFTSFFKGIPVIGAFRRGPFPENRPLLFEAFDYDDDDDDDDKSSFGYGSEEEEKEEDENYFVLNEDGSLENFRWLANGEKAEYSKFDLEKKWPEYLFQHSPLQRFLLSKRVEKCVKEGWFCCRNLNEFRYLFESFKPLPLDFKDQLPETRPLVFKKSFGEEEELRVVLYEDGTLIQYKYSKEYLFDVHIKPCPAWNRPTIFLTVENLKEIVLNAPFKEFTYSIDRKMFRDAFKEIRRPFLAVDSFPNECPLHFKKKIVQRNDEVFHGRWILFKTGKVRKCVWKDSQATFSKGDPEDYPPILTEALIKNFFKGVKIDTECDLVVDRDVLMDCLKEFEILSYVDLRPLSGGFPLIFQRKEIIRNPNGRVEKLHFWLVTKENGVTHVTWREQDCHLVFSKEPKLKEVPPVLKTKKTLNYLLKETLPGDCTSYWYGSRDVFDGYFEGHTTLDFYKKGPPPETRPLVFKEKHYTFNYVTIDWWFLRKDNVLIKCSRLGDCFVLSFRNNKQSFPVALRRNSTLEAF